MVDIERLWKFWNQALQMSPERRKLETVVRALATVDMALRRVRTKRSRQRSIHTWIALVDQSDILRTVKGVQDIYDKIEEVLRDSGLKAAYIQTAPRTHRQGVHIAIGLSIGGLRLRGTDLEVFRDWFKNYSAALDRIREL